MPLGSGNIIQTGSGNTGAGGQSTLGVTLSSATTGNTVLIGVTCDEVATTPTGFIQDAHILEDTAHHYVFRKQTSTGESSWSITLADLAPAAWWIDEVSGLGTSPLVAGISNGTTSAVATISTGTTPAVTSSNLLCVASFASFNNSGVTVTWSGETNSFVEAHDTASNWSGHPYVSIAEARRFPGTSGSFESTATLSTSEPASGILVVYQAGAAPATVVDDVSIGGTFGITAKVTARASGNTSLDLYTSGTTVQGSIVLNSGLSVTGTMNFATSAIGVTAASVTFTVGNVVQSNSTGECMVVRDSWTGTGGPLWSNTTSRSTTYTTTGWTVIGSASLN